MKDLLIPNPKELELIKQTIKEQGKDKLHILTDFDRTLTKAFVKGKKISTTFAQIRQENYLGKDYIKKAHKLFDIYHPIEINPNIPDKEKKEKMEEWWKKHFDLLIEKGINKEVIKNIVKKNKLILRKGVLEFIDFLHKNNIPLIIMSAGFGDIVFEYLKQEKRLYKNVHIIANLYEFDKNGKAKKVREPIIHSLNKTEIAVKDYPVFKKIKDRTNVILLGDGLGDIGMIEGFKYKNLIKIGFLNENPEQNLKSFKQNYDIILLNDTNMNCINSLLKEIILPS